jgi:hypothetical protein
MHPDVMREVIRQRAAERQDEARRTNLARALRKKMRQRNRAGVANIFVPPAIPDYVDGTFHEAGTEIPAEHANAAR